MPPFAWSSLAAALAVVLAAAAIRGRLYATFAAVLLGIHTAVTVALYPHVGLLAPLFVYLQATVYLHFGSLIFPRMRPAADRALLSVPASFFVAGTFLAIPWAIVAALGFPPVAAWVPYALALAGLAQSLVHRAEQIDIALDDEHVPALRRHPRGELRVDRPLHVVQISDPHLGPFMSERRLRRLVERAVARAPDLVLLTGDFVTMESHGAADALARALARSVRSRARCSPASATTITRRRRPSRARSPTPARACSSTRPRSSTPRPARSRSSGSTSRSGTAARGWPPPAARTRASAARAPNPTCGTARAASVA